MKKILVLFVLATAIANAQLSDKNVYFGLFFSGNATLFNAEPKIGNISPDYGYGYGAFLRLRKKAIFAEFELGYSQHKIIVEPDIVGTTIKSNFALGGVDLSGMIGWRVVGIGRLGNFRIFTGYNYGHYSQVSIESNGSQVNDASINSGNSGIIVGTGVDLWKVVLNIKYVYGFSDLSNDKDQNLNSRYATVLLGFKF